jgi:hypothetical protein
MWPRLATTCGGMPMPNAYFGGGDLWDNMGRRINKEKEKSEEYVVQTAHATFVCLLEEQF